MLPRTMCKAWKEEPDYEVTGEPMGPPVTNVAGIIGKQRR